MLGIPSSRHALLVAPEALASQHEAHAALQLGVFFAAVAAVLAEVAGSVGFAEFHRPQTLPASAPCSMALLQRPESASVGALGHHSRIRCRVGSVGLGRASQRELSHRGWQRVALSAAATPGGSLVRAPVVGVGEVGRLCDALRLIDCSAREAQSWCWVRMSPKVHTSPSASRAGPPRGAGAFSPLRVAALSCSARLSWMPRQ